MLVLVGRVQLKSIAVRRRCQDASHCGPHMPHGRHVHSRSLRNFCTRSSFGSDDDGGGDDSIPAKTDKHIDSNHPTGPAGILRSSKMHLMYTLDADGKRLYTLKKIKDGEVTKSAHPARFSPDDKYSRYVDDLLDGLIQSG